MSGKHTPSTPRAARSPATGSLLSRSVLLLAVMCVAPVVRAAASSEAARPNVLLIICDDLNDYVAGFGGHSQSLTPNMARLAASGVRFTQAHCNVPICGPSRACLFSGIAPHHSGCYGFVEWHRYPVLQNSRTLMDHFRANGYHTMGTGKLLHHLQRGEWSEFGNPADYGPFAFDGTQNVPHPDTPAPYREIGAVDGSFGPLIPLHGRTDAEGKPLIWRSGGWKEARELEVRTASDHDPTPDEKNGDWVVRRLGEHSRESSGTPFFMGVGFIRPHTPLIVPQRFFDMFPVDEIDLPTILEGDVEDTFASMIRGLPNGSEPDSSRTEDMGSLLYRQLVASYDSRDEALRHFIQAYLASIASVDEQIGRILDTLESSGLVDNTIVILTSDHGWAMGQKDYLYKNALWQEATRVPLIVRAPGLTPTGEVCPTPVSLVDIYPTLIDLCKLEGDTRKNDRGHPLDGHSFQPLLASPTEGTWTGPNEVLTALYKWRTHHDPLQESYSLRGARWRYIRYENGAEELYDTHADPHEWNNLALDPEHADTLLSFRQRLAARLPPPGDSPPQPVWKPKAKPAAAPAGTPTENSEDAAWKNRYFKKHPAADTNHDGVLSWAELRAHRTAASRPIDFVRDIQPILETHCWHCHGEDQQESGLRLDIRSSMLAGGDYGLPAVVPGDPEKSYLMEVIRHVDADMAMPPDGDKLPDASIHLLHRWIAEGAQWPGQMKTSAEDSPTTDPPWSFQPIRRPPIPTSAATSANPVDAFLVARLREQDLAFSPPAAAETLIRRASIVLTGLPPSPEEVTAFDEAYSRDPDTAYAKLLDRLFASPHFGERWAQHWLDVIRWAETNGSESNMYRKNAWLYRDYVIEAFNADKPYDAFLREQIAGDTLGHGEAMGYLVAGPHVPAATVGQEPAARRQARADRMDEILQTVGASALGLTVGCARCHNHKFDPVSIRDYYALAAVFEDIEFGSRFPECSNEHPREQRGQELREAIDVQRSRLREVGPWQEDWKAFAEIHVPQTTASAIRLTFETRSVQLDELEVFHRDEPETNLALASRGTTVTSAQGMEVVRKELHKLTDGEYGTESWAARVPDGDQRQPWVMLTFATPQAIDYVRLSGNRENLLETDYLNDLHPYRLPRYRLEICDPAGVWKTVAASSDSRARNAAFPFRPKALAELQARIDELRLEGPQPSFIGRLITPAVTHVLHRGSPENPREAVQPAAPAALAGSLAIEETSSGPARRRAFAEWLTAPENPLPARVFVNRLWHHVFGQGLVSTPSDFGTAGASPSHPDLLDWLATELVSPSIPDGATTSATPWSTKHVLRLLVSSRAFRQASSPRQAALSVDARNRLLWRFAPRRLEAEVIRDAILMASGRLDEQVGGRSYRIHNVKKRYAQWEVVDNHGPETWRRMLYQERMRRVDDQLFTAFDFPDCGQVRATRPVSTTPLQALNLLNSPFVIEQSQSIAARAFDDADGHLPEAIDRCFAVLLSRPPTAQERAASAAITNADDLPWLCRAIVNANAFTFLE